MSSRQISAGGSMKIRYDQDVDALTIILNQESLVDESDEARPGIILDYDKSGELISIEILNASEHMPDITTMEYQLTPQPPRRSA
jgi:uncharacterized protein YuzE